MKKIFQLFLLLIAFSSITSLSNAQVNNLLYEDDACGLDYVTAIANLHQRGGPSPAPQVQPVTLTTTCTGTTIRRAFLFFTVVGSPAPGSFSIMVNGNAVNAGMDATNASGTCWDALGWPTTTTYIADVTGQAISGGNVISGIPVSSSGGLDADGVALILICNSNCPSGGSISRGHIRIQTGLRMNDSGGAATDNLNFALAPPGGSTTRGFMIIGDAEANSNNVHRINGNVATFNGNMYNFVQLNNPFGSLLSVPFISNKFGTDCTNLSVIGGYYSVPNACQAVTVSALSTPTTCGLCNGTATANVTGGAAPFSYSWNSTPIQTTASATGLCAGNYTVTVTDDNGCTASASVSVQQSPGMDLSLSTTDATCVDVCNGTAAVTIVTGGTGPFTYLWSQGTQTTASVTGLCPNPISVTVTDANGCTATVSGTIGTGPGLQATISGTQESCAGACDATATVTITNGNSTYSFIWSNGATTQAITGLCSGTYTLNVTDANGCRAFLLIDLKDAGECRKCSIVHNDLPQNHPIPDQDCWWSTGGNSHASVSNLNKLGTTDNLHLRIVTSNIERMRVDKDGPVGVNTFNFNTYLLGKPIFKSYGTSVCTQNDNHFINPYNSSKYTLLVDCTDDRDGYCNGLGIISPETNTRNDRLAIYANQLGKVNFVTLGNTSVYRDKITNQDLWGTQPYLGGVAIVSDFTAQLAAGPSFHAKLWSESNDNNAGSTGEMPAIVGINKQAGTLNIFEKVGVAGNAMGNPSSAAHVPCTNIGGKFNSQNSSEFNYGVTSQSVSPTSNPVYNVGGIFEACGATYNYGIISRIQRGCPSGYNYAGYFSGNVVVNGSGTYTGSWTHASDRKLKTEITPLQSAADFLDKINVYSFNYNQAEYKSLNLPKGKHYGVIAQEIQTILPELVTENHVAPEYDLNTHEKTSDAVDFLSVNYIELIPLLIQSVKDQETKMKDQAEEVEDLKNKVDFLETALAQCCSSFEQQNARIAQGDKATLDQNVPNPFNENTMIGYFLPSTVKNASINIYTVDGQKLKQFESLATGKGSVTVGSGVLAPGAYLYNLMADGKQIDSKWMIVTK